MKANRLRWFLVFLLVSAVFQLPAQQSEADRKLLADIRAKAEKGDAESQCSLGGAYFFGDLGLANDEVLAVKWYRKSAEQNYAMAQINLGICYSSGKGAAKDEVEAVKWYRKAAVQGLADAQRILGMCYMNGAGVAKAPVQAVKWFRSAAEQGHPLAQLDLALCYHSGDGLAEDAMESVKWARKAAEQGNAQAQFNIGTCYQCGDGVPKDEVEAVKWYRKAAEQNHANGQCNLGNCYFKGGGVVKDYVEGYKWLLLAAGQGNESAKTNVGVLEFCMTREQIAEGQQLARSFRPREVPVPGGESSVAGTLQTRPESSGTGFFITEDGYLITNEHVAGNGAQVRLVTGAGLLSAKVVKVDAANDLALLKVEGKFAPLLLVSSRAVKMGSTVATVGFPNIGLQGFAPKLAKGEIAALSGAQDDPRYFQISVPVQPGNSGGALVDEHGNVVGVVAAKLNVAAAVATSGALPENVNYAVKSSLLLSFLESVPEVAAKLKEPNTKVHKFEDVVKSAEQAAVLVLIY